MRCELKTRSCRWLSGEAKQTTPMLTVSHCQFHFTMTWQCLKVCIAATSCKLISKSSVRNAAVVVNPTFTRNGWYQQKSYNGKKHEFPIGKSLLGLPHDRKKRDDFRLHSQFLVLHLLNELNGHGPLNGTGIDG